MQNKESKYDISVTFSSVLEMMKERQLDAEQRKLFGDIEVYATEHLMDDPAPADETTVEGEQPINEQEVAKDGE